MRLAIGLLLAGALSGCGMNTGEVAGATIEPESVTVYVFDEGPDPHLHPRTVAVDGQATPEAAVEALTAYDAPAGFGSHWDSLCSLGEHVNRVEVTDNLVTVRFRDESGATCDLTEQAYELRRQQLAWTVRTATGSAAPVRVLAGALPHQTGEAVAADDAFLTAGH